MSEARRARTVVRVTILVLTTQIVVTIKIATAMTVAIYNSTGLRRLAEGFDSPESIDVAAVPRCRSCNDSGRVTHHARGCDVEEEPATADDHPSRVYDCRSCNAAHACMVCGDDLVDEDGDRACLSCRARETLAAHRRCPGPLVLATAALVTDALKVMRAPRSPLAKASDRQRQLIAATRAESVR